MFDWPNESVWYERVRVCVRGLDEHVCASWLAMCVCLPVQVACLCMWIELHACVCELCSNLSLIGLHRTWNLSHALEFQLF